MKKVLCAIALCLFWGNPAQGIERHFRIGSVDVPLGWRISEPPESILVASPGDATLVIIQITEGVDSLEGHAQRVAQNYGTIAMPQGDGYFVKTQVSQRDGGYYYRMVEGQLVTASLSGPETGTFLQIANSVRPVSTQVVAGGNQIFSQVAFHVPHGWAALETGKDVTLASADKSSTIRVTSSHWGNDSLGPYARMAALELFADLSKVADGYMLSDINFRSHERMYLTVKNKRLITVRLTGQDMGAFKEVIRTVKPR